MDKKLKNKIIGHTIGAGISTAAYTAVVETLHSFGAFDDRTYVYGIGLPAFLIFPYAIIGVKKLNDKRLTGKILRDSKNCDLTKFIEKYFPEIPPKDVHWEISMGFERLVQGKVVCPEKSIKSLSIPEKYSSLSEPYLRIETNGDLESTIASLYNAFEKRRWPSTIKTNIHYEWTVSEILKEKSIPVSLKIEYSWKSAKPKPIIHGNHDSSNINIKVTDKRIEVKGNGNGIDMKNIAGILKPNIIYLQLTEKDFEMIRGYEIPGLAKEVMLAHLAYNDIAHHKKVHEMMGAIFGDKETTLYPITYNGLMLLQEGMRTDFIESSKLERMIRTYQKEGAVPIGDLHNIINYLQNKEKGKIIGHPIITLPWAKKLLSEELDIIEKMLSGPVFGEGVPSIIFGGVIQPNLHAQAGNALNQLYEQIFREEFNEDMFQNDNILEYLKSKGYKLAEDKLRVFDRDLEMERETTTEEHAVYFLKQILMENPEQLTIPYREIFKNEEPEWRITGSIDGTAQAAIDSKKPQYGKMKRLSITNYTNIGEITIQDIPENKDDGIGAIKSIIAFEPQHVMHGLQNDLLNILGIKLDF